MFVVILPSLVQLLRNSELQSVTPWAPWSHLSLSGGFSWFRLSPFALHGLAPISPCQENQNERLVNKSALLLLWILSLKATTYFTLIKGLYVISSPRVDGTVGSPLLHCSCREDGKICVLNVFHLSAVSGQRSRGTGRTSYIPLPMQASS